MRHPKPQAEDARFIHPELRRFQLEKQARQVWCNSTKRHSQDASESNVLGCKVEPLSQSGRARGWRWGWCGCATHTTRTCHVTLAPQDHGQVRRHPSPWRPRAAPQARHHHPQGHGQRRCSVQRGDGTKGGVRALLRSGVHSPAPPPPTAVHHSRFRAHTRIKKPSASKCMYANIGDTLLIISQRRGRSTTAKWRTKMRGSWQRSCSSRARR